MQGQDVIRGCLFVVFFAVGAAAMGLAVLCNDLIAHHRNRQLLDRARRHTAKLRSLNADYDAALRRLEDDPNLIAERLGPAALGTEPQDPETAYPRATAAQLAEAKAALAKAAHDEPNDPPLPGYLSRASRPRMRRYLFACGAGLIILSFVCFGPAKPPPRRDE